MSDWSGNQGLKQPVGRVEFERIVRENIKRDGVEDVLSAIAKTDFYTAPASTRFHGSHEGGLVEHSINVYKRLRNMTVEGTLNLESLTIVALFHDFCKIGFYTTEMRNSKVNGKWVKVPYYTVDDKFPMGHGEKSVIMLMQLGFQLTDAEMLAIRWHMSGFGPKEEYLALGKAFSECPLAVYMACADLQATYLDESIS